MVFDEPAPNELLIINEKIFIIITCTPSCDDDHQITGMDKSTLLAHRDSEVDTVVHVGGPLRLPLHFREEQREHTPVQMQLPCYLLITRDGDDWNGGFVARAVLRCSIYRGKNN